MNNNITVEQGLSAHFKQPTGPSRPGVDWAVRIEGETPGKVIVRTYFSSTPPREAEKKSLADKAARFVAQKLEQGWTPQQGGILEVDDAGDAAPAPEKKPWWKIF
jgi:mannose/cellobiose epimerase-like protein (N-acyl-D-glucosamine 2-epimerase family)